MSGEEISAVEPMDESQLLKDDESHLTTADAVSLFKSSLNKALQRQKSEILSEFKKTQRNKILKIADRHGCDTVHEYLDDPLADSVEDASKLRTAVNVQLTSLTAEVVAGEVSILENFFVASAKNLDPEMTTTVSKTTPSSSTTTDCAFNAKDQDTLPVSVPSKHVPSVVPSQHQPLLQVLHPCLNEKVEYDIEFDSNEYTDGVKTVKND
ncbi:unnamed protein product [Mytilus edulis]|uniref:Uncharacterized protein n=1 Tax=Mytilus edulis TaxID=6550 RepID=A0A8S3U1F1_MYTED|nr:unnamed protein product [Mytilus edulis]